MKKVLFSFSVFVALFIIAGFTANALSYDTKTFSNITIPSYSGSYTSSTLVKEEISKQYAIDYYQDKAVQARVYGRNILGSSTGYSNWKNLPKNSFVGIGDLTGSNTYGVMDYDATKIQIKAKNWSVFSFQFWGQWIPEETVYNYLYN